MKSWKTTSAGILMICAALTHLAFAIINKTVSEGEVMGVCTAVVGGLGLIVARDNDKSSEDVGANKPQ